MAVLLLDNFLDARYSKWFSRYRSDDLESYQASAGHFPEPEDLNRFEHVIVSGSEDSVVEDRDWVDTEMELVRELVRSKIPTIGFCYGHQLIARALAGPHAVRRSATPEFGWQKITLTGPALERSNPTLDDEYKKDNDDNISIFSDLPSSFHAFNSHFDEVIPEAVGDQLLVMATSANCAVQAFKVKEAPMWGTQFHPEINSEDGLLFLRDIVEYVAKAGHDVKEALGTRKWADETISPRLFANFYRV